MNHALKKIKIELGGGNIAFEFNTKDGHVLTFNDLSRAEQIRALNALARGYQTFLKELKNE